ncbi:peptidoglycan-binding domain-containing protein [Paractinoplanes hotanensis]|uniref:Peptidoglycan-binding protein n=1 Tax=Paractinoplanes hotanensis TaxID=2906497 RepID=A0ABT0YA69_9ACTN|nr:peptidoglycan-binding protein [Actinoplanes hotanensis]MCM4082382.1 peptidoglycan-binding protein [Actinoplanes hotanensis]
MRIRRFLAPALLALTLSAASLAGAQPAAAAAAGDYRITIDMLECDVMAVGVQGTCIISLQTWLNIFDDTSIPVTGYFDQATKDAVIKFQSRHGLQPDGRFGDRSRLALYRDYVHMKENSVATPRPGAPIDAKCNPATGVNCDKGAAIPGINGGIVQSVFCNTTSGGLGLLKSAIKGGAIGIGAGIACDILLS